MKKSYSDIGAYTYGLNKEIPEFLAGNNPVLNHGDSLYKVENKIAVLIKK